MFYDELMTGTINVVRVPSWGCFLYLIRYVTRLTRYHCVHARVSHVAPINSAAGVVEW